MGSEKIVTREELKSIITQLQGDCKRIVFTNGCFDLIHAGHVRYLNEAKRLGDILIVGLNSDASVSSIKPGRPIIPESQRADVLAALEMVDYVVLFHEDTPYALIREIEPDILVKGADWKKEEIVGNDLVADVRTIPIINRISTSDIIKKIQKMASRD